MSFRHVMKNHLIAHLVIKIHISNLFVCLFVLKNVQTKLLYIFFSGHSSFKNYMVNRREPSDWNLASMMPICQKGQQTTDLSA